MQGKSTATAGQTPRISVDPSGYPDLVVVYLGFRVTTWRGLKALLGIGKGLNRIDRVKPDGLLCHETVIYGLNHIGMRQYWRDFESLEAFTRSEPHKTWWRDFGRDPAGSGFWHEAYRRSGGMEAIYLNLPKPIGFATFAAEQAPVGPFMTSRQRIAA
ncbi:monooxygenase family protein [Methylobacterium gnaphalii]|uniref:Uncharacterized protein n=1 Tax=Methylobacterium gnaphalii TaxID=1010610 RepID=A0A512JJU0_9HYPH|nr:DUF4188 domain-containing protein [Methylobacterium gnaphalii]GEP10221.1 hypothetical protein MGN01_20660 [Methylobacterium gnaphalii]GJD68577.1 hypothetical protein MMMDOFMJ_1501 [Methylobacterium gnaphalii]GLS48738.1 hypothetical protein GCM10007885_15820 [Methylobacterium gnaphalii]